MVGGKFLTVKWGCTDKWGQLSEDPCGNGLEWVRVT